MRRYLTGLLIACLTFPLWINAWAGTQIEVVDPRYFEREHDVIFPHAEVKLVTFEFTNVQQNERGKERAKELHDQFLQKIHDLHGGAVITYVTPPGQHIENYRVKAEQVARSQKAQMVLWGHIFIDKQGASYIKARLMLIEPPPGISSNLKVFSGESGIGHALGAEELIDAPVKETRIDFNAFENDVTPLAYFLSGLARYYKGAVRERQNARRWLRGAVDDLQAYVERVPESVDRGSLAQAHLYLARAYFRLAATGRRDAELYIEQASRHSAEAARLNPYNPAVPTSQAVISVTNDRTRKNTADYLQQAIRLAPTDADARMNSAIFDAARGQVNESIKQLDNAATVQKLLKQEPARDSRILLEMLNEYQRPAAN